MVSDWSHHKWTSICLWCQDREGRIFRFISQTHVYAYLPIGLDFFLTILNNMSIWECHRKLIISHSFSSCSVLRGLFWEKRKSHIIISNNIGPVKKNYFFFFNDRWKKRKKKRKLKWKRSVKRPLLKERRKKVHLFEKRSLMLPCK